MSTISRNKAGNKLLALLLAVALIFTMVPAGASADSDYEKGTADITILDATKDSPSMADSLFGGTADITVDDIKDTATMKIKVVNPVPAFPDQGKNGTIKDFTVTYENREYKGTSDIKTKPLMTAKASNGMFGLEAGKEYTSQVITVTLPEDAIEDNDILNAKCFINVVMNREVNFRIKLSNLKLTDAEPDQTLPAEEIENVTLDSRFTAVDDDTYKYRSRGKQVNAVPVVKNSRGEVLKEGTDYTVEYSSSERVKPGEYEITVRGINGYKGSSDITLVITPKAVKNLSVRHSTAKGGYDDAFLRWDKSAGATGYQVYARIPSDTSKWTMIGRTSGRNFSEKNLKDGKKYEFRVLPYITADETRYRTNESADIVSMRTLIKGKIRSVKKSGSEKVKVSWKNISGESGYQVMAAGAGKKIYLRTKDSSVNLKVVKNKKYTYKVRAYKNVKKNGKNYRVYAPWSDGRKYTLK